MRSMVHVGGSGYHLPPNSTVTLLGAADRFRASHTTVKRMVYTVSVAFDLQAMPDSDATKTRVVDRREAESFGGANSYPCGIHETSLHMRACPSLVLDGTGAGRSAGAGDPDCDEAASRTVMPSAMVRPGEALRLSSAEAAAWAVVDASASPAELQPLPAKSLRARPGCENLGNPSPGKRCRGAGVHAGRLAFVPGAGLVTAMP